MPRRFSPKPRITPPDPRYGSTVVQMFINRMMYGGKKSTAQNQMYLALGLCETRAKKEAMAVLEQAMYNVAPSVEVKPRRVGGSTYQVPLEVSAERGQGLAMRWILAAARNRSGRSFAERLAGEILDASNSQGSAVKKKDETHKMAEANRAFAHYRW